MQCVSSGGSCSFDTCLVNRIEEIVRKAHDSPKKKAKGDINEELQELHACECARAAYRGCGHWNSTCSCEMGKEMDR